MTYIGFCCEKAVGVHNECLADGSVEHSILTTALETILKVVLDYRMAPVVSLLEPLY